MVYSWLLKTNLSDASESPNPCTQALQGQKVSRQARRIRGFWVNVSEYSLEWHEHRTTMWQCECWGELDAYLFFCVFLVEFACCLACFWVLTLCLFAFKLTPFLNSMIGVDGLDVVDMCWAAVRMYSGYSWRFLETSQCDVTMILPPNLHLHSCHCAGPGLWLVECWGLRELNSIPTSGSSEPAPVSGIVIGISELVDFLWEILQACPRFDSKTSVCCIFFPINPSQSCQNSKKRGHLAIYEVLERHRANLTGGGPKNPGGRGATLDVNCIENGDWTKKNGGIMGMWGYHAHSRWIITTSLWRHHGNDGNDGLG
jgi:hypothetical protein